MELKKKESGFLAVKILVVFAGIILASLTLLICGLSLIRAEAHLKAELEAEMFHEKAFLFLIKNKTLLTEDNEKPEDTEIILTEENDEYILCMYFKGVEKGCTLLTEEDFY